ncbi:MAG: hypothetical protein IT442_02500, partial [Phycisphaeraceae bacterium]|nr:hypothetical protein [Phycisphaeraceae bacterium]
MTENRASKRWLRWLPETAILVVWTTSIFGLVWSASTERANVLSQVHAQSLQMIDHEGR